MNMSSINMSLPDQKYVQDYHIFFIAITYMMGKSVCEYNIVFLRRTKVAQKSFNVLAWCFQCPYLTRRKKTGQPIQQNCRNSNTNYTIGMPFFIS